ncbi:MAG TPA: LysM domain-containing protein [Candidatus Limnocylindrales bacterium]|nr:LysM domain-containing protein [Candidatus Limnocylindrales bacterium]
MAPADEDGTAARRSRRAIPLEPLPDVTPERTTQGTDAREEREGSDARTADLDRLALAAVEAWPGRSPRVATCPFLRLESAEGLVAPLDAFDEGHRCLALDAPLPQSRPQQELVCLQAAHARCPRYLAGLRLAGEAIVPAARRRLPLSIAAAFVVLALAVATASAYMLANGGLVLRTGGASPTAIGGAPGATPVTPQPSPAPTLPPSPSPSPSPTTALTTPPPTVAPTPAASPPGPTPTTIASRFAGLERCPPPEDCYIYVVQRGNNLDSIARYFGTTLQVVLDLNPQIDDPNQIRAGDRVKLPPPPD